LILKGIWGYFTGNNMDTQENFYGNGKHLKMLLQSLESGSPEIWNRFCRSMGPAFAPDLSGIKLEGRDLRGYQLARARLAKANLRGANLTGIRLESYRIQGADLSRAQIKGSGLKTKVKARPRDPEDQAAGVSGTGPEKEEISPEVRKRMKLDKIQEQAVNLLKRRKDSEIAAQEERDKQAYRQGPITRIMDDED